MLFFFSPSPSSFLPVLLLFLLLILLILLICFLSFFLPSFLPSFLSFFLSFCLSLSLSLSFFLSCLLACLLSFVLSFFLYFVLSFFLPSSSVSSLASCLFCLSCPSLTFFCQGNGCIGRCWPSTYLRHFRNTRGWIFLVSAVSSSLTPREKPERCFLILPWGHRAKAVHNESSPHDRDRTLTAICKSRAPCHILLHFVKFSVWQPGSLHWLWHTASPPNMGGL